MLGFTRAAARELAEHGIRVNAVAPGPIETTLIAPYRTPEWLETKFAASVLKRLGRPDEVAAVIVWLLSDEASYSTASFIDVAGGR